MKIETHLLNLTKIAELTSESRLINSVEDGITLLADLYYQDFDRLIIHQKNITPDFFDLKNGMAGDILQKCSNFRVWLAIVGDFEHHPSKSLQAFIRECNRGMQVYFAGSVADAVVRLGQ